MSKESVDRMTARYTKVGINDFVAINLRNKRHLIFVHGPYAAGVTTLCGVLCDRFMKEWGAGLFDFVPENVLPIIAKTPKREQGVVLTGIRIIEDQRKSIQKAFDAGARVVLCDHGPLENVAYRPGIFDMDMISEIQFEYSHMYTSVTSVMLLPPKSVRYSQVRSRLVELGASGSESEQKMREQELMELDEDHFEEVETNYRYLAFRNSYPMAKFEDSDLARVFLTDVIAGFL